MVQHYANGGSRHNLPGCTDFDGSIDVEVDAYHIKILIDHVGIVHTCTYANPGYVGSALNLHLPDFSEKVLLEVSQPSLFTGFCIILESVLLAIYSRHLLAKIRIGRNLGKLQK